MRPVKIKTIQHVNLRLPTSGWQCASRTCCWSSSLSWKRIGCLCWEIRLWLKRSEAATGHTCIQGVVKFCPSWLQVVCVARSAFTQEELAWTNEDHAHSSARAALNTRTHLQFLVYFFSLVCSSPCRMICKTSWGFCGARIHQAYRHNKAMPCSGSSQFEVKTEE